MSNIRQTIDFLRREWAQPREAIHRGEKCPFLLACSFAEPIGGPLEFPFRLPNDVLEFWHATRHAALFKDQQYGQWGVEMLEPTEALSETSRQVTARPRDFFDSDLVLARFFGDSDLVVLGCNPNQSDYGSVTIALPIDKRSDWPTVASSLGEFLSRLIEAQGDKYWEVRN
jgi:hypothetical protein